LGVDERGQHSQSGRCHGARNAQLCDIACLVRGLSLRASRTNSPQVTLPCLTVMIVIVIIIPSGQLRSFVVIVTPGSRTALLCVSVSCLIYSKTDRVPSMLLYLFIPPPPYSLPALSHSTLNRSTLHHA